jgi:anti-repressor protein
MQELIKIQKSAGGKDVVSARELHQFLEVKTAFGIWMKRMKEYGFVENVDYAVIKSERADNQVVVIQDFVITVDMAKELSMIQRTEKGKQARLYFIECEKIAKQQVKPVQTLPEALQLKNQKLEVEVKELEPLAKVAIKVLGSNSDMTTTTVAKELGLTAIQLNKILHENKVQYYQDEHWVLYTNYKDKGYTKLHTFTRDNENGTTTTKHNTKWTEKGRAFIREVVEKHFEKMDNGVNEICKIKTA